MVLLFQAMIDGPHFKFNLSFKKLDLEKNRLFVIVQVVPRYENQSVKVGPRA